MRKYISESQDNNFIYPNNDPYQYGVELVQDINNNSVSGTVTNFLATVSSNIVTISFDYNWSLNGAEPYISQDGDLMLFSVHMMEPSKIYYKPWRLVEYQSTFATGSTTYSGSFTTSVTASQMGVTTLNPGTYYFEIRMIGHRAIFPICVQGDVVQITPTPTPTKTPTPTPTPVASNPCYCYDIVVTGTTAGEGGVIAEISYNNCFGVLTNTAYTIGPGTYHLCIQRVGGVTQYFSASGIDESYLTGVGAGNCNTGYVCSGFTPSVSSTPTPTPTSTIGASPTPTPTPSSTVGTTPTPTPTPSSTPAGSYEIYTVDRYICDSPTGPCTYVETISVANPTVLIGGKFYYDNINGYIINVVSSGGVGPYLYIDSSGLGTNNCNSLCGL